MTNIFYGPLTFLYCFLALDPKRGTLDIFLTGLLGMEINYITNIVISLGFTSCIYHFRRK